MSQESQTKLDPFSVYCMKCGRTEVAAEYCESCATFLAGEHLHRCCTMCTYSWVEACRDAGPFA